MMTRNEQLARDGYEALMRGETEVAEALMAPDLTWH
jgi:ketosteroid isomerase-like protein